MLNGNHQNTNTSSEIPSMFDLVLNTPLLVDTDVIVNPFIFPSMASMFFLLSNQKHLHC